MISKTIGFRGLAYFQTNPNAPAQLTTVSDLNALQTRIGELQKVVGCLWLPCIHFPGQLLKFDASRFRAGFRRRSAQASNVVQAGTGG